MKIGVTRKIQLIIKRGIDILFSLAALLILWPFLLLIALIIKLSSKGPALFYQDRLGKDAKVFLLYKFRTMVPNAQNMGSGLSIRENDPRITPIGSFLRKTSLDELPQLFNILKGDISFVGPRPTVPQHLEYYGPFEYKRLSMRPGLTGLAMIRGRANNPWSVRIRHDVEYVERYNLMLDLVILWKTVWVVLKKENTYYDYEKHGKPPFDLEPQNPCLLKEKDNESGE